ncbi:MAG: prepilin-type N-terminal cleavage/methylation domain-containing protein [Nitrospirota bacterium]|jgi:type IV pilus assembly protein PilV
MGKTLGQGGFSLTELMIAMTILAVGLLALAQLQIVSMQGTISSKNFSTATNLARETIEWVKVPGVFVATNNTVTSDASSINAYKLLENENTGNDTDALMAPLVNSTADIAAIAYDSVEVLKEDVAGNRFDQVCFQRDPGDCDDNISDEDTWDYVRIVNVRNLPAGAPDGTTLMKDVNVIVLWKEMGRTRSISIRTLVARKDSDFF